MDDIKKLSPKVKAAIIVAVILLIGYFDWFYFLSPSSREENFPESKIGRTTRQIKEKEKAVLQFDKYKADVAALRDNYNVALQKLPAQREIPGLFHSVALAGKDAGIDFLLFEPKAAYRRRHRPKETQGSRIIKAFRSEDKLIRKRQPMPKPDSKKLPAGTGAIL